MTNNTIPNVPRELLERAATSIEQRMCIQCEGVPCCMPESLNTLSDIRALLSAPSPAGVDDGWIKRDCGECPADDLAVDYKMRNGAIGRNKAGNLVWRISGKPYDIIAYRIHKDGE